MSVDIKKGIIAKKERGILENSLKKQGLSEKEVADRISDIEVMMMDMQISETHPDKNIRRVASDQYMSQEDKEEIYKMTQSSQMPYDPKKRSDRFLGMASRGRTPLGINVIPVDEYAHRENPTNDSDEDYLSQVAKFFCKYGNPII